MVFHESPTEAVAAQKARPFDAAVVDMRMPVMTGLETIKALTACCPTTICMILTGTADLDTAIAAINETDVFRFYTKPCSATVLADGIEQAIAHGATKAADAAAASGGVPPQAAALGVATLNRLPTGVVVVDRRAHVLFMNSRGAEYMAGGHGFTLGPTGTCRASRPAETADLHRLIEATIDRADSAEARAISVSRTEDERPLSVIVAPLVASPGANPVAVLLVGDPDNQTLPSVETVTRLFELTDAEARLALALAEGQRIEEAAEVLGITLSSARTYLKRIFGKTGVTRQAELVRLVMAAPTLADLRGGGK
jgi:DNA-binding NarL/FixJ family response regulator